MSGGGGNVRLVLAGACGKYTGTVVEWQLEHIKATSACSSSNSLYDVTAQQFTDGLIATWPNALAALNASDYVLALLFQGRLVANSALMSESFPPGTLDIDVAGHPTSATASPVIHLVFRNLPKTLIHSQAAVPPPPTKASGRPPAPPPPQQQRAQEAAGCCLVA